jgi:hypothetical protein
LLRHVHANIEREGGWCINPAKLLGIFYKLIEIDFARVFPGLAKKRAWVPQALPQ